MEVYLFHGPKMAEPTKRPALRVKTSGPLGTIYILSSRIYSIILKYIYIIYLELLKSFLRLVTSHQMGFQSGQHLCSKLHALMVMCSQQL